MAPLSKEMCGLILPHDYFGSHLNSKGETVDDGLEVRNFRKAAEVLAEVWTGHVIDGHVAYLPKPVSAVSAANGEKFGVTGGIFKNLSSREARVNFIKNLLLFHDSLL